MRTKHLRIGFGLFPLQRVRSGLSPAMMRTHTSRNSFLVHWYSRHDEEGLRGSEDTGSFMCTGANTRSSSAEILSSGKVSSGSRDTTRSILSSVRPARFNACQPATSQRAVTMSTATRFNLPSCSLNRTSHMAIGSHFRPGQRVVSEKGVKKLILGGRKLFSPRETSATRL